MTHQNAWQDLAHSCSQWSCLWLVYSCFSGSAEDWGPLSMGRPGERSTIWLSLIKRAQFCWELEHSNGWREKKNGRGRNGLQKRSDKGGRWNECEPVWTQWREMWIMFHAKECKHMHLYTWQSKPGIESVGVHLSEHLSSSHLAPSVSGCLETWFAFREKKKEKENVEERGKEKLNKEMKSI